MIEPALAAQPAPHIRFVYLDLPSWLTCFKRHRRGIRLYYVLWQLGALYRARRLHRRIQFDLVHHVTFANVWLPALTAFVGPPFILGPVSGGQRAPLSLIRHDLRLLVREVASAFLRQVSGWNPLVRLICRRAALILCTNEETRDALPPSPRTKARLRTNATAVLPDHTHPLGNRYPHEHVALTVGILDPLKGFDLAVRAVARTRSWRLWVIGNGPEESRLRALAHSLGIANRVEFMGWLRQDDVYDAMRGARAVLVPSLREGASFVAAEAATLGARVIALDHHGVRTIARQSPERFYLVPVSDPASVVAGFATSLTAIESLPRLSPTHVFSIERLAEELDTIYRSIACGVAYASTWA